MKQGTPWICPRCWYRNDAATSAFSRTRCANCPFSRLTKPAIIAGVVLLGAAAALASGFVHLGATADAANSSQPVIPAAPALHSTSLLTDQTCVAPRDPRSSPALLAATEARAHDLSAHGRYDAALAEFRALAEKDPGHPGVNLDLSVALLQLNQPAAAREAIDRQLATSDCLANLPPSALQAYCEAEATKPTLTACNQQLQAVRRLAFSQAALLQIKQGDFAAASQTLTAAERQNTPRPAPRASVDRDLTAMIEPAKAPAPKRLTTFRERELATGAGTDADMGAYRPESSPQPKPPRNPNPPCARALFRWDRGSILYLFVIP